MRLSTRDPRRAVSLLEVLVALSILVLVVPSLFDLFTASQRIGHSARRQIDVVLHGQSLLEAVAGMQSADLPQVPIDNGGSTLTHVLLSDHYPRSFFASQNSSPRWQNMVALFFDTPPPLPMTRTISARQLATGEMVIQIDIEWESIQGEVRTEQSLQLEAFSTVENWP